jgi:hypothetical protein
LHQGDRAGQRRANTAAAADPGRPHRVAHPAESAALGRAPSAAGLLPDVAYELNAALVTCQAALTMCQLSPMRGSARGRGGAQGPRSSTARTSIQSGFACSVGWLENEPDRTATELLARLQTEQPGIFPGTLLRTLQRRLSLWRQAAARKLVFMAEIAPGAPDVTGLN